MTTAAVPVLEAEAVVRTFGGHGGAAKRAVDGVSLALGAADCLALFGPNGAGKTTLLRLLGGMLRPTAGTVRLGGAPVLGDANARARVGFVSHHTMLYDALTPLENVTFAATLYGVADPRAAAMRALDRLGAASYATVPVRGLSRGMQQRVAVARAVVHEPSVVLADEPFTGLDASGAASLAELLAELRDAGATLVIVTHHLDEGLRLATRAAIMRAGRFVRADEAPIASPAEYAALYRELAADAA